MHIPLLSHAAHSIAVPSPNNWSADSALFRELALALTISAAACLLRLALDPWLGPHQPLTLGLAAVAVAAWLGAWRTGIVTALVCHLCLSYVFVGPQQALSFSSAGWLLDAATYYLTAAIILVVNQRAAMAQRKATDTADKLRQRDAGKAEFLALLGHELRNPLLSIRMGIEVLKQKVPDDAASRRTIEMVQHQFSQMVRLVNDLLDTSRMDHGKIQLRLSSISVESIVTESISAATTFTAPKKQRVLAAVASNAGFIEADRDRVGQILGNVLHNASKFSPRDSAIHVYAGRTPSGVLITVRDAGIGVAPDQQDLIFGPFVQLRSGEQTGLGLGLPLVRKLMEMHGGTAEIHSEGPGRGSEFTLTFPRTRPSGLALHPSRVQRLDGAGACQDERQWSPDPTNAIRPTLTDLNRRIQQAGFREHYLAKPISLAQLDEALGSRS